MRRMILAVTVLGGLVFGATSSFAATATIGSGGANHHSAISSASHVAWDVSQRSTRAVSRHAGNQTGSQATSTPVTTTPVTSTPTVRPTVTPTLPAGPSTVFYVLAVRFEKNGAAADWNLKRTPQKVARPGTKIQLSVYFNVSAIPTGSSAAILFTLSRNGRTIISKKYTESIPRPTNYKTYLKGVPLPTTGKYHLTIRVSVNGITDQGSANLKVTSKG